MNFNFLWYLNDIINGAWSWGAQQVSNGIGQVVEWLAAMLWSVLEWFWSMIERLMYLLPNPFAGEWLLKLDWEPLIGHAIALMQVVDLVLWVFPVGGVAIFYLAVYALCGSIRLVRWVLAFVPTIGG